MGDVFKEQLVKRTPNNKERLIRIGIIAATLVLSVVFGVIALIASIIVIIGGIWLLGNQNKEYEYIYTNGELDIDVIYNRSKRKKIFSVDMRKVDIMAHVNDTAHQSEFSTAEVIKDFSSGIINDNTYQFLFIEGGKKTKVIIEPNEDMLKVISMVISPRKMFKYKNI